MVERYYILLNFSLICSNSYLKNIIKKYISVEGNLSSYFNDKICFLEICNDKGNKCIVLISDNTLYLYSDFDNKFELNYRINDDGYTYSTNELIVKNPESNFQEIVEEYEEFQYGLNKELIYKKRVIDDYLRNIETKEFVKDFGLVNFNQSSIIRIIGNKLVMIENSSYFYDSSKNSEKYFVSDYQDGMLRSVDGFKNIIPKFVPVSFEEYNNIINNDKNKGQKVKTML